MQYDPYDVSLVGTGGSNADLSFKCDVGDEHNLQFTSHTPDSPTGEIVFDRISDPNQSNLTVTINYTITDRAVGEDELIILVKEDDKVKGRYRVIYL